jgi:enoyl reductase-like protein
MGGDARIEMMCRNIAETGMVDLFRAILRVAMYQLKGPTSIKVPNGFKQIQPSMWHDQINISCNVGLGNGRIEEKQLVLKDVMGTQQTILQTFGLSNPMVTWDNFRNSIKQYIRLAGLKNIQDFFPLVTSEQLQQFQQQQAEQAAQAAQQQAAPAPDVVGAAKVKAEADLQMTQAKLTLEQQKVMATLQAKMQGEMQQLQIKMQQEMFLELARIDQQRDAANQQFATDAIQVGMDSHTAQLVARENASNQIGPNGSKPKRPLNG